MSTIDNIDDTENALYHSSGDVLTIVRAPNADNMWIEYNVDIQTSDKYLMFDVVRLRGCVGYVNITGISNFVYNFISLGRHTVEVTGTGNIVTIRIGGVNATTGAVVSIDWLSIRDRSLVTENERMDGYLMSRMFPDVVESFDTLNNWKHSDSVSVSSGYAIVNVTTSSTIIDSLYVENLGIDTKKYPNLDIEYVLKEVSGDAITGTLIIDYYNHLGNFSHTAQILFTQSSSTGYRSKHSDLADITSNGWVSNITIKISTFSSNPNHVEMWIDQLSITDDINEDAIVSYSYTTSESFTDISDWNYLSGLSRVNNEIGKFEVSSSTRTFNRSVPLVITGQSYLEFKVTDSDTDNLDEFNISLICNNGDVIELMTTPPSGTVQLSLAEHAGLKLRDIMISMEGSGYVSLEYLRVTDHSSICIICDTETGWDLTSCTVTDTTYGLQITTPSSGSWSASYMLPEPIKADIYDTLEVIYTLDEDASPLPEVSISGSSNGLGYLLIADGEPHVLYLDLNDKFGTGTFDALWIESDTSTTSYNITIDSIRVLSKDDTSWSKVSTGTNTYIDTMTSGSMVRLNGFTDGSTDDGVGAEHPLNVVTSNTDYATFMYRTIDSSNIYLEVYILVDGTKYSQKLTSSISWTKATLNLAKMFTSLTTIEDITAIGVTLNWTTVTNEYVWAEISGLKISSSPLMYLLTDDFSGADVFNTDVVHNQQDDYDVFTGLITSDSGTLTLEEVNIPEAASVKSGQWRDTNGNFDCDAITKDTWTGFPFNNEDNAHTTYTQDGNDIDVEIGTTGHYLVLYGIHIDTTYTDRLGWESRLKVGGTAVYGSYSSGYTRNANNNDAFMNGGAIISATQGDDVRVEIVYRTSNGATRDATPVAGDSYLQIIQLDDSWDYFRAYADTTTTCIEDSWNDINWQVELEEDSAFSHGTPADEITLDAGHYLVIAGVGFVQSTKRSVYLTRLALDGIPVETSYGYAYIRDSKEHYEGNPISLSIIEAAQDDVLTVQALHDYETLDTNRDSDITKSGVTIVKLPDGEYYRGHGDDTIDSSPSTSYTLLDMVDTEDEEDTGSFSGDAAGTVNIDSTGQYLIFFSGEGTRASTTDSDRDTTQVKLFVSGSEADFGGGWYDRGDVSAGAFEGGTSFGAFYSLSDTDYIDFRARRTGDDGDGRFEGDHYGITIVNFGGLLTDSDNYKFETTFEWIDQSLDDENTEVAVYVDSHTGSEDLKADYWDGDSWETLGTVDSLGWNTMTAIGINNVNYTIKFYGETESSDTSEDTWVITSLMLNGTKILDGRHETEGDELELVADIDMTYARIDPDMGDVEWNIPDTTIDDEKMMIRWRYDAASTPAANSFMLTVEHDGVNATAIDLLGGAGSSGVSPWYVNFIDISGYTEVTAVYLKCNNEEMHIDYVSLGEDGFRTIGTIGPDSWKGTLTKTVYGYNVTDTINTNMMFDKVDKIVTDDTMLDMRIYLDYASTIDLDIKLYGLSSMSETNVIEDVSTEISIGWNVISINVSEIVSSSLDIVTAIEVLMISDGNTMFGIDYLKVYDRRTLSVDIGSDYFEIGTTETGLAIYNLDTVTRNDNTFTINVVDGIVEMFVGRANFSEAGPVNNTLSYLEDGLPYTIMYNPTSDFMTYTDGHSLNLYVITDTMEFTVGENDTDILLDEIEMVSYSYDRVEFTLFGWLDSLSINRTYIVTSSGMVNWTTDYASGISTDSVKVWQDVPYSPLMDYRNGMEDLNDVTLDVGNVDQLDRPLTEGFHALKTTTDSDITVATGLSLTTGWKLHLSVNGTTESASVQIGFLLDNSSYVFIETKEGDTSFDVGDELGLDCVHEIQVSAVDIEGDLNNTSIVAIGLNITSVVEFDDLYLSSYSSELISQEQWIGTKVSDSSFYEYIDTDTTFSDSQGIGLIKSRDLRGMVVYGDLTIDGITISTGTGVTGLVTETGWLTTGEFYDNTPIYGRSVSTSTKLDINHDGSIATIIDIDTYQQGNITLKYYNADGTLSDYRAVVSSLSGESFANTTTNVQYLGLETGKTYSMRLDAWSLFVPINTTDNELPTTYEIETSGGIISMTVTNQIPTVPLTKYWTVSMNLFLNVEDDDTGIEDEYVTHWITSPRDVMDKSLRYSSSSVITRYLTADPGDYTYDELSVTFHTWLEMDEDCGDTAILQVLEGNSGTVSGASFSARNNTDGTYTFWLDAYDYDTSQAYPSGISSQEIVAEIIVSMSSVQMTWVRWNINFGKKEMTLTPLYDDGTPSEDTVSAEVTDWDTDITTIRTLRLMLSRETGSTGSIGYYIDDVNVLAYSSRSLFREDFSYGDLNDMLSTNKWDESNSDIGLYCNLEANKNMGRSRSILKIDPVTISNYQSIDATAEFMNGWYTSVLYDNDNPTYDYYYSGYDSVTAGYLTTKYYQHYMTTLDIPQSGIYRLNIWPSTSQKRHVMIDSLDNPVLNTTGQVDVYLDVGFHPLYVRMYDDGDTNINALKVKIQPIGMTLADTIKSHVPKHGRFTAVYYDANHASRMREIDSPSYYMDPETVLDKAAALMTTSAISGTKVLLDADDVLDYMLRDINTGTYVGTKPVTPMFESAGSVLMTSDTVPDTIFMGEADGSIVERFLEYNGHITMDGNIPFYITTHNDGSSTVWPLGPEWVLDMRMSAWYSPEGTTTTFGPRDLGYKVLENVYESPEMWGTEAAYDLQMPDIPRGSNSYWDDLRISLSTEYHAVGDGHPAGIMIEHGDFGFMGGGWTEIGRNPSEMNKILFAPGGMEVELELEISDLIVGGGAIENQAIGVTLSEVYIDGYYVDNPDTRIASTLSEDEAHQLGVELTNVPIVWVEPDSYEPHERFTATIDLSGNDELYKCFVDFISFVVKIEAVGTWTNLGGYGQQASMTSDGFACMTIYDMVVRKDFAVMTKDGIDDKFAMAMPILDSGYITDLRMTRTLLPHHILDAQNFLEGILPVNEQEHGTDLIVRQDKQHWSDKMEVNLLKYDLTNIGNVDLEVWYPTPDCNVIFGDLSTTSSNFDQNSLVSQTDFLGTDHYVHSGNYKISFDKTTHYSPESSYTVTPFWWQISGPDNNIPYEVELYNMYKFWMPDMSVTIEIGSLEIVTTSIGKMIFGDLNDYDPLWSIGLETLSENDRRFMHYGVHNDTSSDVYANPISLQADSLGGGILTYGLSQHISREHVYYNASIAQAYMEYITQANHMNMWGHVKVKNALDYVELSYTREDRLELWNEEGWLEELVNWMGNDLVDTSADFISDLVELADANPWIYLLVPGGRLAIVSGALEISLPQSEDATVYHPELNQTRIGNGALDQFIEKYSLDADGADWYSEGQYPSIGGEPQVDSLYVTNQTLKLRPTLDETSDWDDEAPEFDLLLPFLELLESPGSIKRHQLVRGKDVVISLNWTAITDEIGSNDVYVTARMKGTGVMDSLELWYNQTLSVDEQLVIDLENATGHCDDGGTPLYMSDTENSYSTPIIEIYVYQKDPRTVTDFLDMINNMIYADVVHVRAEMDMDYIGTYMDILRQQREDAVVARWGMFILGAAMVATAPWTGGASAIWGLDLMCSSATGKSMFDYAGQFVMHGLDDIAEGMGMNNGEGFWSDETIENFQFMHFTSDRTLDLILQELVAEGISSLGGKTGGKLKGLFSRAANEITEEVTESLGRRAIRWLGERISGLKDETYEGFFKSIRAASKLDMLTRFAKWGGEKISSGVKWLGGHIKSAIIEVIMEWSFDSIGRLNKNERPGFGNTGFFFTLMTVGVMVGAIGGKIQKDIDGNLAEDCYTAYGFHMLSLELADMNDIQRRFGYIALSIQLLTLAVMTPCLYHSSIFV
ncbi:MAG: hypothetical protein ACXABN_13380 [Candidatus Thorarchaeota archaeon]